MRFSPTPEQEALRTEIREYLDGVLTPEDRAAFAAGTEFGDRYREFVRRLGADGWLGVGWPVEYGGRGFTPVAQAIFFEEVMRAGARLPFVTLHTVGPTLMRFGSQEQKAEFLPAILRGDVEFAIGYTEPGAGTDLASLSTRAVRDGDGWVINGTKVFTSGAESADYIWLAARTDPDAPKHRGITIFIVPTSSPGYSWTRMPTMGGMVTCATYFSDVRVPDSAIVGGLNEGWRLITAQLNFERVALAAFGPGRRLLEDVIGYARRTTTAEGQRLVDVGWVRSTLARADALMEAYDLLNARVAWAATEGTLGPAEASAVKVYGTEVNQEVARLLLQVLGHEGVVTGEAGPLAGRVERACERAVVNTFGGGANEVQREIIATAGLGLPRSGR